MVTSNQYYKFVPSEVDIWKYMYIPFRLVKDKARTPRKESGYEATYDRSPVPRVRVVSCSVS